MSFWKNYFRQLIIILATILGSAAVVLLFDKSIWGFLLAAPVFATGIYFLFREDGEATGKQNVYRMRVDEKTGLVHPGHNESLEKNPPPAGEYWKNVKVTRAIAEQIFADLDHDYVWLLAGYGSALARKKLEWHDPEDKSYSSFRRAQQKTYRELVNDLDFDSALETFAEMLRHPGEKYPGHDFAEVVAMFMMRDRAKSFAVLETLVDAGNEKSIDVLRELIGLLEEPEWNRVACEVARRHGLELEEDSTNQDIAEYSFEGKMKYFGEVETLLPKDNAALLQYHVLLKKAWS